MHWKDVVVLIMDPIHYCLLASTIHDTTLLCMLGKCRAWFIYNNKDIFIDSINMVGMGTFSREVHTVSKLLV